MNKLFYSILLILCGCTSFAEKVVTKEAENVVKCVITTITDGDTLACHDGVNDHKIRLMGVDAPELKQICKDSADKEFQCGVTARNIIVKMIKNQKVACQLYGKDLYQRNLGVCYANNLDIGEFLLNKGYAVTSMYGNASKILSHYYDAENKAKITKKGIWAGSFESPTEFRKKKRSSISATKKKESTTRKNDL